MNISFRAGSPGDAENCGSICYEAFKAIADQHNFPRDFPNPEVAAGFLSQLFARGDIYSVVAEVDGRVAGSNFLWENAVIAGVGPITVDPGLQNSAVGRRLMEDVMRRARERRFAGVRLVQAAYHNRSLSLYTKLGFDAREPLSTLQGPALGLEILSLPKLFAFTRTGLVSALFIQLRGVANRRPSEKLLLSRKAKSFRFAPNPRK